MAEADWTEQVNVLNSSSVKRGVTAGETPPNGGGSFTFGMASKVNTAGGVGLYTNLSNFSPMAKGGVVTCALKKKGGGGDDAHAPYVFIGAQGTDINDNAYMLGLSEDDPPHLILRKGSQVLGLPDDPVGSSGVLAKSTGTYDADTWYHFKLEMVVNDSGDVVLNVYENDLTANAVTAPSWAAVAGMKDTPGGITATAFIDDALGVNSGSLPYTSGRVGYGSHFSDISRASYFDHLTVERQL
jgi:hypothetical protein